MGREDLVHLKLRAYLKSCGFRLVAGQFPNGSDDELQTLTIRVSGDIPRSYHLNSFVPDLVALSEKDRLILIIEIKPKRSISDEEKLLTLLSNYHKETMAALVDHQFFSKSHKALGENIKDYSLYPAVSFYGETLEDNLNPELFYFLYSKNNNQFISKSRKDKKYGF